MYLVICKSKITGLSIDSVEWLKWKAEATALYCNKNASKNTYHVRKFDLASIDLEKLMEEDNV